MSALALIRIAHIGSCVIAFGALAFELFVAPRDRDWAPWRWTCRIAIAVAIASWFVWLAELASQMSGAPMAQALRGDILATVLSETTFGHVWFLRMALLVVSGLMLLGLRESAKHRPILWLATALCAASLASIAWTGHALGAHPEHAFIDAAHLLAAGLWLGMLVPLLATICAAHNSPLADARAAAASAARRFTIPGSLSVVVLAISGAFNAWWLVGSIAALSTTDYGLMVTAKIALFALMLVLAASNRWIIVPRVQAGLRSGDRAALPLRWLLGSVTLELALGLMVLTLAGVLGITPPAAHEHSSHPMHHTM